MRAGGWRAKAGGTSTEGHEHAADDGQLVGLRNRGLHEDRGELRVDAGGQVIEHHLADIAGNFRDGFLVRPGRERMQVRHNEERFIFVLQADTILYAADPVAEVQSAGRAIAGEDSFLLLHVFCESESAGSMREHVLPFNRQEVEP